MKKNIWIFNHYATGMFLEKGGRHYWMGEELVKRGYQVTIFCANTVHNSVQCIKTGKKKYVELDNGIKFVVVKATEYDGNGIKRIENMISFSRNLYFAAQDYKKCVGKPDIILASSVHPLTLIIGEKIGKKFHIPVVCEIRDLWPESIVAYGKLKRNSIMARLLYREEKKIYEKADAIIMTWEGGKQYLYDKGWDKDIKMDRVYHICNGIVNADFEKNIQENIFVDKDLDSQEPYIKAVYTGSIRMVNQVGVLIKAAEILQNKGTNIKIFVFGDGTEREQLEEKCKQKKLENIVFKGQVQKKYIPSILNKCDICILHNRSTSLDKYGQSQNKLFEYMASENPILQTYHVNYSIIEKYGCGIVLNKQTPEEIAQGLIEISKSEEKMNEMGRNAKCGAREYDFGVLTEKLIHIIEEL